MKRRLAEVGLLSIALFGLACRHDWPGAEKFAQQVRCGMTEVEIRQLAAQVGVSSSAIWRQHPSGSSTLTVKPRELDFVDILLQSGEAVAVQRSNYVAFTTGMEFGAVRMLCGAAPRSFRTLRDSASEEAPGPQ